jgi:hypothetical protein
MIRADDPTRGEAAYTLADTFCAQARTRIEQLFGLLWNNADDLDRRLARQVLAGDLSWLEDGVVDGSEGTGPWIATWEPGPSLRADVSRRRARQADAGVGAGERAE